MLLIVEPAASTYDDTMSVGRLREVLAEVLGERMARVVRGPSGEEEPATPEVLAGVEVVEQENGRPIGVRPHFELYYREARISQAAALMMAASQFRGFVLYTLGHMERALEDYQPALDWRLVGALVDPVQLGVMAPRVVGREPTPEEVNIRLATQQWRVSGEQTEPPQRLSSVASALVQHQETRWYIRTVWSDVSGGADYSDPAGRSGGTSGLTRYSETRQLRHMPSGTRKNREQAIKLLQRIGAGVVQVAPATGLPPAVRAEARRMAEAGTNLAVVAQTLGYSPEEIAASLPPVAKVDPTKRPGRR
jgi:transposase-like protein